MPTLKFLPVDGVPCDPTGLRPDSQQRHLDLFRDRVHEELQPLAHMLKRVLGTIPVVDEDGDTYRPVDRLEVKRFANFIVPSHLQIVGLQVGHRLAVRVDDADEQHLVLSKRHPARTPGCADNDEGGHEQRAGEGSKPCGRGDHQFKLEFTLCLLG